MLKLLTLALTLIVVSSSTADESRTQYAEIRIID